MQQFISDEAGYLDWIDLNPYGLVVNSARTPASNYLKLHRATCRFISPPMHENFTTTGYIKTCSLDRAELAAWAGRTVNGVLDPCSICKPDEGLGRPVGNVSERPRERASAAASPTVRHQPDMARPVPPAEFLPRMAKAVETLEKCLKHCADRLADDTINATTKAWLDGTDQPLAWSGLEITADEWFFISTLYGEMSAAGQRTHIRKFYPHFVHQCKRDIRNFTTQIVRPWPLRSDWMRSRLCRMAEILTERGVSMLEYAEHLRRLECAATPTDPMPALDAIIRDHRATGWKTLSVFVRDCVQGNCFPIDTRVQKCLQDFGLPNDERNLVSLALRIGKNPRHVARLFYEAGGEPSF